MPDYFIARKKKKTTAFPTTTKHEYLSQINTSRQTTPNSTSTVLYGTGTTTIASFLTPRLKPSPTSPFYTISTNFVQFNTKKKLFTSKSFPLVTGIMTSSPLITITNLQQINKHPYIDVTNYFLILSSILFCGSFILMFLTFFTFVKYACDGIKRRNVKNIEVGWPKWDINNE